MKVSIKAKLAILILVLLVPVVFAGVNKIYEEYSYRQGLKAIQDHVLETEIISRFIHELQKERALSLVYLASSNELYMERLQNERSSVDHVARELQEAYEKTGHEGVLLTVRDKLITSRKRIDDHAIGNTDAESAFTEMIAFLIEQEIEKANRSSVYDMSVRDAVRTHFHLVEAKEELGKLRISVIRIADKHDSLLFDSKVFAERKGSFNIHNKEFKRSAPRKVLNVYDSLTNLPRYTSSIKLIDSIYTSKSSSANIGIEQAFQRVSGAMSLLREAEEYSMDYLLSQVRERIEGTHKMLLWISILIFVLLAAAIFLSWTIFKSISISVRRLKHGARKISVGKTDTFIEVTSHDELGELADIFNDLVKNNQMLSERAEKIGEGDYSLPVTIRSEEDELGNALEKMRLNLKELSQKDSKRKYILEGVIALNETMEHYDDLQILSPAVLNLVCEHSQARVGVLYLMDDQERLELKGSYAISRDKLRQPIIHKKIGLVAQAVEQEKPVFIEDVPPDYMPATSGLGSASLKHLMILPLINESEVIGAMEIGSVKGFTEAERDFLRQAAEKISVVFYTVRANQRLKALLQQTQQQTEELRTQEEELRQTNKELSEHTQRLQVSEEELRTQQEELRQTNEELEEQTQRLRASEEELRTQQEELQEKNAQLEEKTQQLEEKNDEMERKNHEVEKARKALDKKARELEVTSKYKSDFLANMSHELRTPLNSILILAKLLAENKPNTLNEKQVEFAEVISRSGNDLLNLINEILDISKIEAGRIEVTPENIDLDELKVIQDMERMAEEKSIHFSITKGENLPASIYTDRQRLQQVLRNLISNALKFTDGGGNVNVKIAQSQNQTFRNRHLNEAKSVIAFAVSDTGIGIPEEKREVIFQAFQQAESSISRKYGGTGLGLSISREIATLLGGQIDLESEVGKGSTFTLYIPDKIPGEILKELTEEPEIEDEVEVEMVDGNGAPSAQIAPEAKNVKPSKTKATELIAEFKIEDSRGNIKPEDRVILILEDDPEFARILKGFALERNFKTLVTNRGDEGMRLAKQYKPDAIILDLELPVVDGYTILNRLKANRSLVNIPVQVISGHDKEKLVRGMGADGYSRKPVDKEDLEQTFDKLKIQLQKDIKRILIIEDNEVQNIAVQELICQHGGRCFSAMNGKEGLDILEKEKVDCVVIDLNLPDISGFDLLEKVKQKKKFQNIPFIVYSGRDLTREEERRLKKHSGAIVMKTAFSYDRLLDEVNLFLHHVETELPREKAGKMKPYKSQEALSGKKVLVVDDDIRNIYALYNVLEEEGMNIYTAENGQEALDKLSAEKDMDIVLMDIMMPVMDGYEAMRKIREQEEFTNLPIIALTAKAMKGDREKCIEAGASDYLAKPIDNEKLVGLMRVWLYQ